MPRKAHLVGAWPGHSPAHAMQRALIELGPHLLRMTDGETGPRAHWIRPTIEALRANPDVELARDGDYTSFRDRPTFQVRPGRDLDADRIGLGYAQAFHASFPGFKVLRERFGRPDLRFQVGIPHPLDLVASAFGPGSDSDEPRLVESFTRATVREIAELARVGGDEVVFQIESFVSLLGVIQAPKGQRDSTAERFAKAVAEVAKRSPSGTRFGVHFCIGDKAHGASSKLIDIEPLVTLVNALGHVWPLDRQLDYVHGPFSAADQSPSYDERFFGPLRDLALPAHAQFVAGFVHEAADERRLQELHQMIERVSGREVDVAAPCGLARRNSAAEAQAAMRAMRAVAES